MQNEIPLCESTVPIWANPVTMPKRQLLIDNKGRMFYIIGDQKTRKKRTSYCIQETCKECIKFMFKITYDSGISKAKRCTDIPFPPQTRANYKQKKSIISSSLRDLERRKKKM